jgi:hypothetical protein
MGRESQVLNNHRNLFLHQEQQQPKLSSVINNNMASENIPTTASCSSSSTTCSNSKEHNDPAAATTTTTHVITDENPTVASSSSVAAESKPLYNPDRVFTSAQLEVLQVLVHPVWIFDIDNKCMKWANMSALELWNSASLKELQSRSFHDMSDSTITRLKEYQCKFQQGQRISDQWTVYPRGIAKQLQIHCSGIRLDLQEVMPSMLVEGIPLVKDVKDEILAGTIRGVEMLRHLPLHVCQFDMDGNVMFQNPEATVIIEKENPQHEENDDNEEEGDGCDPNGSSSSFSVTASLEDSNRSTNSSNRLQQQRVNIGDFVDRFVDPSLGRQVLEKLHSGDEVRADLEAEIHTNHGPRWSAIQLRKTVDPVTGNPSLLYSARDISDAIQAKKEREAKEQKSEFLAIMVRTI